ncbi:hypothetical protein BYT27DRAFT_6516279 [Phlegmacium glaucopus]|nr:hypothetical protein BYT27DRAFT_6516279 [Phlegmacium glaucopus]
MFPPFHDPVGTALDAITLNDAATTKSSIPPVPHSNPTSLSPKRFHACFFSLALCIIVSALDSVVVPTTIPTLTTGFHAGSLVQLTSPVYLLSTTSLQMLYGRFNDIFGRKTSLSIAMIIFMVGNSGAGFSATLTQLLIFRAIAGAGGGGIISLVQIVVSDVVAIQERAKYQTIIGGLIAFGFAIGPLISGAFLENATWRWCFWISVPISLCAFVAVTVALPSEEIAGGTKSMDFVGAILILCGCISMILPLIWGGVLFSWDSPPVLVPLLCGVLILVVFCVWEWKGARLPIVPIVPMYIFKHTTVAGVYITTFLYGFIHFASLYYIPQFLQVIMGYNPIRAGIVFIPFLIITIALSWIGNFIIGRTRRYKNMIHCGYVILTLTCGVVLTTTKSHIAEIVALMIVAGAGAGQTLQTPIVAVQASVSIRDMSAVTAFRNFIRCLGGTFTLGVGSGIIDYCLRVAMKDLALSPSLINAVIRHPSSLTSPSILGLSFSTATVILERGYAKGFKMIFVLNAALTAVATIISILMIRDGSNTGDEEQVDQTAGGSGTASVSANTLRTSSPCDIEKMPSSICENTDTTCPTSADSSHSTHRTQC